jgi:Fe-S oxidoreductase
MEAFRKVHQNVTVQSRMQASDDVLERLGQRVAARTGEDTRDGKTPNGKPPDFVFYTGCNLLNTPHIALTALDIMDALGVSYQVMGGPTHCCGINQFRPGDVATSANMAETTMNKLARGGQVNSGQAQAGQVRAGQVLAWCGTCYMQFTEVMLPAHERRTGSRPFEMTPFMRYLGERIDDLRPLMRVPVPMRVALHRHPGVPGVVEATTALLTAVPGVELVDLGQPAIGLMSTYLRTLPDYKKRLQLAELEAAAAAGVDALVAVYHGDHRELCAHERDWPFRILNVLDVVGASMGLAHADEYKRLKILQDADLILAECRDRLARHGIAEDTARASIKAMLNDQPLPLQGR